MRGLAWISCGCLVALAAGCSDGPRSEEQTVTSAGDGNTSTSGTGTTSMSTTGTLTDSGSSGTGSPMQCECAPGTDVIQVLSDDSELWAFDPATSQFSLIGPLDCTGFRPFSMAVDRTGQAWTLLLDNIPMAIVAKGLFQTSIADASGCEPVAYTPGLFGVFGMSFVTNASGDNCEQLYVLSYSGSGPFSEGPGIGNLGVLDPETGVLNVVGAIDFDGGELAGTGDGRLFAFAGDGPAKLVEYDKTDASVISTTPLTGLSKTNASAVAFFGGDFFFFTEAGAPGCRDCLAMQCAPELAACEGDPACPPILDCLINTGGNGAPGCEGDIVGPGGPLRDCMLMSCGAQCDQNDVVSKVTHFDFDGSDGTPGALTEVNPEGPIRIVGAGSSTCVPVNVP